MRVSQEMMHDAITLQYQSCTKLLLTQTQPFQHGVAFIVTQTQEIVFVTEVRTDSDRSSKMHLQNKKTVIFCIS